MQCEACHTEISTEICPKCGLKQPKIMCFGCFRKFFKPYLKDGLCPSCYEKESILTPKSPTFAILLSVIPGLGQVYLGQKEKGFQFFTFFVMSLIFLIIPIIGWFLTLGMYLLPGFCAYTTAKRVNSRS